MVQAPLFYPIVDSLDELKAFSRLDYQWIQLRRKDANQEWLKKAVALFQKSRNSAEQKLILNDDAKAAVAFGYDGVHLGQEDLEKTGPFLQAIKNGPLLIGISSHSLEEANKALACQPNYLAIGPVFPTASKPELSTSPVEKKTKLLHQVKKINNLPVVAIGGIDEQNSAMLLEQGFNTLAFISWKSWILERQLNPEQLRRTLSS